VFSFWKKSLSLVGEILQNRGIRYLKLDGDVPYKERKSVLRRFQDVQEERVLLMTLGIGAVG
jgi:SWI/SNF-related matrix-associated actin-dependent regulator of chromatin subfamily A3